MNAELEKLTERIRRELMDIERVIQRIEKGWEQFTRNSDDCYLDSVALNLHGFYAGLERTFSLIAEVLDNSVPTGDRWHYRLLQQMTEEVENVRPAVISGNICDQLDEYRRFRHVVRNVYTFSFDATQIAILVKQVRPLFVQLQTELLALTTFLHQVTKNSEDSP